MMLALSLALAILPLLGVVWIFMDGMITLSPLSATVDGLFMSLILLALSATFLLNTYWELRDRGVVGKRRLRLRQRNLPQRKRARLRGYADSYFIEAGCIDLHRRAVAGVYVMVARNCALTGRNRGWSECWHLRWCSGW